MIQRIHIRRDWLYSTRLQTSSGTFQSLDGSGSGHFVNGGTSVLSVTVTVHLHELGQVELRLLEHLDLSDKHVLKGEDSLALLLDLEANGVRSGDTVRQEKTL